MKEYNLAEEMAFIDAEPVQAKKQFQQDVKTLQGERELIEQINTLHKGVFTLDEEAIKEQFKTDLLKLFKGVETSLEKDEKTFNLKIIFIGHDYEPEARVFGYGDGDFNYPILDEPEYVKYNFHQQFFSGAGPIDYSIAKRPILDFEESLDEEILEEIEDLFSTYYIEVGELYVLNIYRLLHAAFTDLASELLQLNIPKEQEVFIYGNEHDGKARNIFLLSSPLS